MSWSQYANTLQSAAKKRYKAKLEYDDGAGSLTDPYFVKNGWQKDPSTWPDLTFGDIYHYEINNTPGAGFTTSLRLTKAGLLTNCRRKVSTPVSRRFCAPY